MMTTLEQDAKSAKEWMKKTGLVVLYPVGSKEALDGLWENWQALSDEDKSLSDQKSIELFGMDNSNHHDILELLYV